MVFLYKSDQPLWTEVRGSNEQLFAVFHITQAVHQGTVRNGVTAHIHNQEIPLNGHAVCDGTRDVCQASPFGVREPTVDTDKKVSGQSDDVVVSLLILTVSVLNNVVNSVHS